MGLIVPASLSIQHRDSKAITHALVERILLQDESLDGIPRETRKAKADASSQARRALMDHTKSIKDSCSPAMLRVLELASEKGASSRLTCCPLRRYRFVLNKEAFRDSLHLRYGWIPSRLPSTCPCGASFTPERVWSCPIGGYPSMHHNDRDSTASLLKDVAHDVSTEPSLQPITGETLRHRTAISAGVAALAWPWQHPAYEVGVTRRRS